MKASEIASFSVSPSTRLYDVIKCIDRSARFSVALVVDEKQRLIATLTDGDVRRAILAGFSLDNSAAEILRLKKDSAHPTPITAPLGMDRKELLALMEEHAVRQVPLVDYVGRVQDIVLLNDLIKEPALPLQALIMAGGVGQRLRPLTASVPKPMLTVGEKPLLEHIVRQLKGLGIKSIAISTHFMPEVITRYFGDGSAFGVEIEYFHEEEPLGTGGVLGMLPIPRSSLLVINGDILTQVDFRSMFKRHKDARAMLTLTVRPYSLQIPYGVIVSEGESIQGVSEKPKYNFLINAGIYMLDPGAFRYVPNGESFNMTDLIQWLLNAKEKVISFPIVEYWLDIGRHSDYERAQIDFREGTFGNDLD